MKPGVRLSYAWEEDFTVITIRVPRDKDIADNVTLRTALRDLGFCAGAKAEGNVRCLRDKGHAADMPEPEGWCQGEAEVQPPAPRREVLLDFDATKLEAAVAKILATMLEQIVEQFPRTLGPSAEIAAAFEGIAATHATTAFEETMATELPPVLVHTCQTMSRGGDRDGLVHVVRDGTGSCAACIAGVR